MHHNIQKQHFCNILPISVIFLENISIPYKLTHTTQYTSPNNVQTKGAYLWKVGLVPPHLCPPFFFETQK